MKRRDFITLLGGAAAAWPVVARAQQSERMRYIGYFSGRSPEAEASIRVPFLKALEELGFAAGRNFAIEYRFAEGDDERLPMLAAELVRRQVAMLVATDRPSASAAKAATATIPIVFTSGSDPVQYGLVASFNRPGGNAAGAYSPPNLDQNAWGCCVNYCPNQARSPLWSARIPARRRIKSRKCRRPRKWSDNRCSLSAPAQKRRSIRRSLSWQNAMSLRFSTGPRCFSR